MHVESQLLSMSDQEWASVETWVWDLLIELTPRFIARWVKYDANFCEQDDLKDEFMLVAHSRLISVVKRNPNAVGDNRRKIVLGTLKAIAQTAFRASLASMMPIFASWVDSEDMVSPDESMIDPAKDGHLLAYADFVDSGDTDEEVNSRADRETELLRQIESVRSILTPLHHHILYNRVFNCLSVRDLAHELNRRDSSINKSLLLIRDRISKELAPDLMTSAAAA